MVVKTNFWRYFCGQKFKSAQIYVRGRSTLRTLAYKILAHLGTIWLSSGTFNFQNPEKMTFFKSEANPAGGAKTADPEIP